MLNLFFQIQTLKWLMTCAGQGDYTITLGWPVLQDANYDHDNNNLTNIFRLHSFKWCDLLNKFFIETFSLSSFLWSITLINYTSSYLKMEHELMNNARD